MSDCLISNFVVENCRARVSLVTIALLLISFSICSSSADLTASVLGESFDIYSESVFLGREGVLANSLRVRTEADLWLAPYLTAGSEAASRGQRDYTLDPVSHGYFGGGLRFRSNGISLRAEARARVPVEHTTAFHTLDLRLLGVYGTYLEIVELPQIAARVFIEPYAEALFTTADLSNLISTNYVRSGIRWPLTSNVRLDLFLEPYLLLDTRGHYYNNRFDFKPSVRLGLSSGPLQAQFIFSYLWNTYFTHANAEPNPYRQKDSSGVRVLVVVGALL